MNNFIYGIRPLTESIESGKIPEKILLQKDLQGDNFLRLFNLIRKKGIPYQMVPVEKLNRVTRNNHQGIIAYVSLIDYLPLDKVLPMIYESGETPLLAMADGITDVRNIGAMARSAECAGVHAIIIPEKGVAPISADAIKASSGALSRLPICREANILESIAFLKSSGVQVVALSERGKKSIYQADLTKPSVFVLGSEGKGISPSIRRMADELVSIPMTGKTASLNVSVAAGVVFFESKRQREFDHE